MDELVTKATKELWIIHRRDAETQRFFRIYAIRNTQYAMRKYEE